MATRAMPGPQPRRPVSGPYSDVFMGHARARFPPPLAATVKLAKARCVAGTVAKRVRASVHLILRHRLLHRLGGHLLGSASVSLLALGGLSCSRSVWRGCRFCRIASRVCRGFCVSFRSTSVVGRGISRRCVVCRGIGGRLGSLLGGRSISFRCWIGL